MWTQTHPEWYSPPGIPDPPGIPLPDPPGIPVVLPVEPPTAVTFPTLTLPFLTLNPKVYEYAALFSVISATFPLHFLSQAPVPFALPLLATVKVNSQVQVFLPTLTDSSSKVSPPALSKDRPITSCWVITICISTMGTHSHPSFEPIWPIVLSSERTKGMVIGAGQTGMLSIGQAPSHSGQTFRKPGAQSPPPYPPPGIPDPDPVGIPVHPEPDPGMPVHPEPVGMPVNPEPDPEPVGSTVAVPDPDPKGMVVAVVEPPTAVTFPTLTLPFLTLNPKVYEYAALFSVISATFPLHFLSQAPVPFALPLPATVKVKSQVQVFLPTFTLSPVKVSARIAGTRRRMPNEITEALMVKEPLVDLPH